MRSLLGTLFVILAIAVLVVLGGLFAALGVGAVGWVVHRVFGLTQWQGTVVALGTVLGVGFLVYHFGAPPPVVASTDYDDWDDDEEDEPDPFVPAEPPPVVAWRQRRPTPGALRADKPAEQHGGKKGRSGK